MEAAGSAFFLIDSTNLFQEVQQNPKANQSENPKHKNRKSSSSAVHLHREPRSLKVKAATDNKEMTLTKVIPKKETKKEAITECYKDVQEFKSITTKKKRKRKSNNNWRPVTRSVARKSLRLGFQRKKIKDDVDPYEKNRIRSSQAVELVDQSNLDWNLDDKLKIPFLLSLGLIPKSDGPVIGPSIDLTRTVMEPNATTQKLQTKSQRISKLEKDEDSLSSFKREKFDFHIDFKDQEIEWYWAPFDNRERNVITGAVSTSTRILLYNYINKYTREKVIKIQVAGQSQFAQPGL